MQAAEARRAGAATIEGYPVKAPKGQTKIPAAFAYTGTLPLFEKSGFSYADKRPKGKQRMRKAL